MISDQIGTQNSILSDQIGTQNSIISDQINRGFAAITDGMQVNQQQLMNFINYITSKNYKQLTFDMMNYWMNAYYTLNNDRDTEIHQILDFNDNFPRLLEYESRIHNVTAHAAIQDTIDQNNNNVPMIDNNDPSTSVKKIRSELMKLMYLLKNYLERQPHSGEYVKQIGRNVGFNKFFYGFRHRYTLFQGTNIEKFFSIIEQEQPIDPNSIQNYIIAFNSLNPTTVDVQYANEINNIFAQQLNMN